MNHGLAAVVFMTNLPTQASMHNSTRTWESNFIRQIKKTNSGMPSRGTKKERKKNEFLPTHLRK